VKDFLKGREDSSSEKSDSESEIPEFDSYFKGSFLLVETKPISSKMTDQAQKNLKNKQFRKLHLVSAHDSIGPIYLKNAKKGQKLEQIDQLTILETTSKFVNYDSRRGIVFMLNREKQDRHIKLFTIKIK